MMKASSIFIGVVVFFMVFMTLSCQKDNDLKDESREIPSVAGQTMTVEDDGEEITFAFNENGEVFISGSEFGEGITASFEQEDDDLIITIGDKKIFAFFDGEEFELEEPEYFPPGYNITAVGLDAYQARVFTGSEGDTIRYRLFIPKDYDRL
jgi:predicted peptidase